MYLKLKKGKLKGILKEAFNKSGSIRRLEKKLKIPKSTLSSYHQEKRFIEEKSLMKILRYLNKNIRKDFISKKKPNNIPTSPSMKYKEEGWVSWYDWLGYKNTDKKKNKFLPFKEAREYTRKLKLKNQREWNQYIKYKNKQNQQNKLKNKIKLKRRF